MSAETLRDFYGSLTREERRVGGMFESDGFGLHSRQLVVRIRDSAMPMGTRHRETGLLLEAKRGLVLQVDGGGVYALDTGHDARKLIGQRVTVEGTRSGFDRLDIDWIGPASTPA